MAVLTPELDEHLTEAASTWTRRMRWRANPWNSPRRSFRSRRASSRGLVASRREADAGQRRKEQEAETMKAEEVRDLSLDQLQDELIRLKKEQFNLRFQKASGQLENTGRVREVRRDIARIKTVLTQKSAASAKEK